MRAHFLLCVLSLSFVSIASDNAPVNSETNAIKSAVMDGYQSQRNLAYGYAHGWGKVGDTDYLPLNPVKACAWRKIIILANSDKADSTDYANESTDCKKVSASDNGDVWKLVFTGVSFINKAHNH